MALPPEPTILQLIQEGMRKAIGRVATSGEQARALDEWIEEIKNDIWQAAGNHRLLENITFELLSEGKQQYSVPSDMDEINSIIVLDGDARDTAQSGTLNTITLAAADSTVKEERISKEIILSSGTGSGQKRTITAFNESTKVATVDSNWSVNPDSTTKYIIVNHYNPANIVDLSTFNLEIRRTERGRPFIATIYNDNIFVFMVPDKTYGMIINYWINIQQLDKTAAAYQTMIRRWRSLFVEGIFVKTLNDEDDARYDNERRTYLDMISKIVGKTNQIGHITGSTF